MAKMRKINDIRVGKDMEQLDCSCTAGGSVNWYNHFQTLWQAVSTKVKHMQAPWPRNSISKYISKINECVKLPKEMNKNIHSKAQKTNTS